MKKLLIFITFAIALILPVIAAAQSNNAAPVKWAISVTMTGSDTGILTLKATPSAGWHLYSTTLPEGGPRPTEFNLSESTGLRFDGELMASRKPLTVEDQLFGMNLSWWDKPVQFTVKFKLDKGASTGHIKAKITFMACNDVNCAAPMTITLDREIQRGK